MSNVAGLRECWSEIAFGKNLEFDHVPVSSASDKLLQKSTNEQRTVHITQDDPEDEVEEIIYLDEGDDKSKDVLKVEQLSLSESTLDLESTSSNYSNVSNFDIIPDELIIKIMSFLPLKELYQNVALISRRFKDFALSPILWQHLDVDETRFLTSESLKNIICKNCPLLKTLDLSRRDELFGSDVMVYIAKACPLLQHLTLSFNGNINSAVTMFAKYCPRLRDINMEGCDITDDCLQQLTALPLINLNMSHCMQLTDEGIKVITTKCNYLKSIDIDGVQWITDDAVLFMVKNCCEHLEKLRLDGDNITDKSIKAISTCENLKVFSVSFCDNLSDKALTWIQQMKNLYSLKLKKGVGFSAVGLHNLFTNLHVNLMKNSSGLLYLSIPECSALDDTATQALAESCPNLITLNLSWCWDITDPGLRHIIVNCNHIQALVICGLTDIQGECLIDLPKLMPHLKYLDASQCNSMSDDVLMELVDTVPNITVIDYYSEVLQPKSNENSVDVIQKIKFI